MGADRQQREHPRLFLLLQLADVIQRTFEKCPVILAPRELQIVAVAEPFQAMGRIETDVRHDLVFGHEAQARALQVMSAEAVLAQLCRQAGLIAFVEGEHFHAFGRAIVELVVVTAQHGVQTANGLMGVQHVIRGVHAALGPAAEVGHQIFLIMTADRLTVGTDVGAGNAFERDDQHIARLAWRGEQLLAIEIDVGEPGHRRCGFFNVAVEPFLGLDLQVGDFTGEQLMRQVVQAPGVAVIRPQVLRAPMGGEQHNRRGPDGARQSRARQAATNKLSQQPESQGTQQSHGQGRVRKSAASGVFDELRVDQVVNIRRRRQAADGADQFCRGDRQQRPEHQHRQGQPPCAAMQRYHQQTADGQIRQKAQRVRPAQRRPQAHRHDQYQNDERKKAGIRPPQPVEKSAHKKGLLVIKGSKKCG